MNRIRIHLTRIALALAFVAILGAALFAPVVQTWIAQAALSWHPELHGSVDAFSAAFGKVEIANLHLETRDGALTIPSLSARLPVMQAIRAKKFLFDGLVSKGWTLDLTASGRGDGTRISGGAAPDYGSPLDPTAAAARAFAGVLSTWSIPCDIALNGADLEGDVLASPLPGKAPVRFHVIVKGGELVAGGEGRFAARVSGSDADPTLPISGISGNGEIRVSLTTPRTVGRIEFNAEVSATGGVLAEPYAATIHWAVSRTQGGESYALDLVHAGRHLATVEAQFSGAKRPITGTWKADLRHTDAAPFFPERKFPLLAVSSQGTFDTDPSFGKMHGVGSLSVQASQLGALAADLDRLGAVTSEIAFDAAQSGHSLHFERLVLALAGDRPVGEVRSLQPFEIDESSGKVTVSDAHAEWLAASVRRLPVSWLAGLTDRLTFTDGALVGELMIGTSEGIYTFKTKSALKAVGVSALSGGKSLGKALDASVSMEGKWARAGWEAQGESLTLSSAGRTFATAKMKLSHEDGVETPIAIAGSGSVDLEALGAQSAIPGLRWIAGRSIDGDFTASFGALSQVDGNLVLKGHDSRHSLSSNAHAEFDSYGGITFYAPLKVAWGSHDSELTLEGSRSPEEAGARFDIKMRSKSIGLGDLRPFAGPIAAASGATLPSLHSVRDLMAPAGPNPNDRNSGSPDRVPFWGGSAGKVAFTFDRLRVAGHELVDVGGTLDIEHGSFHLAGARAGLPRRGVVKAEGTVSFDGAASTPYAFKGTASVDSIDASRLFGAPKPKFDPLVEGHFSASATFSGKGLNFADLAANTQEEFQIKSTDGIVRILKTSVSGSFAEPSTPVKDSLGVVGTAFGALLGVKHDGPSSGVIQRGKNTEAVIGLTYQIGEFVCDQISVKGVRAPDGSLRFSEIAITAPDEHLTGTGSVSWARGMPARTQPLSVDFQIAAKGNPADLLSTAGLLSGRKDALGYSLVGETVHFGGTIDNFDSSQWHDLLVMAANRKPPEEKKSGAAKAP